jgi:hypothetical protein
MFQPELGAQRITLASRQAMLGVMADLVRASPPLSQWAAGGGEARMGYCPDPPGRDILMTVEEISGLRCGECKKHAMLGARQAMDAGARHVELCMTVTDDPEEHVFCRVDGRFRDYAVEAGMPVREIGDFIAVTVWRTPPSAAWR